MLDSDTVKNIVNLGTKLVQFIDKIGPLKIALVGLFIFLEKNYSLLGKLFKPAEEGVDALKKKLESAEKDLQKATETDLRKGTNKTAEKRRNAEERVNILKQKVQEASEDAVLDGIDESFDPDKVKKSLTAKKGNRTKRINKLQAEGATFDQIQADPKVQQYTKEIKESEQALNEYNAAIQRTNVTMQQASASTQANTVVNQANASSNTAKATTETADAAATTAGATADVTATTMTKEKTAATWADVWAEMTRTGATGASVAATIKQVLATKLASSALVQKAATEKGVMTTDLATLGVTKLLTLGFYGLIGAIKTAIATMWTFMTTTPIGWILLAASAVAVLIASLSKLYKSAEELQEELNDYKSKLSDIRSELDSINQELKTTNERMDELLAKDKLTFEEQEELDSLKATNDELERRKDLLESEEEYKAGFVGRQAAKVVDKIKWEVMDGGSGWYSAEDEFNNQIDDYKKIKDKFDNATTLKEQEKYQKQLDKKSETIENYILSVSEALDGVKRGDSKESDKSLDYFNEIQDVYAIARGSAGAKTNAIKGVMQKDSFSSMSKSIDYYVAALKDGNENAANAIAEIINENEDFVEDLKSRGLDAQDAIDLYTNLGENLHFSTLDGKMAELKRVTEKLPEALNNIGQFMDDDEVDTSAIAEYFKGTSDKTREEIAKLIQDINEDNIDVEHAIKKFELFSVQSVLDIEISEVQTNFKDVFTDLENSDGIIDTFKELADAISSTSNALDALNAAQAEMAAGGRVSIETALKLMEYTDDYSKVLTISEGKLVLNENAEENLIEARIENMKASAQKALEDAKAARETTVLAKSNAEAALSTYNSAMETEISAAVTASAWDKVLAAAAGLLAGIKALFTDESWAEAYDRAYQNVLSSRGENRVAEVNAKYASAEEQAKKAQLEKDIEDADKAIEEQDKEIQKLQGNVDLVNKLNKDNIGDVFKSDDLDNPGEVEDDLFQKEMDYWENQLSANQAKRDQIQNEIDLLESQGKRAGAEYYGELIALEKDRQALLEAQKTEALKYLSVQEIGSEEWWNAAKIVNDLEGEIDDSTAALQDYADAQAQIKWDNLEEIINRFSDLHDEISDLRDILQRDDMFDENGNWTESGAAVLGTYVQDLEMYKNELATLQSEIADLQAHPYNEENAKYLKDVYSINSEQEYNDLITQWNKTQREMVKSAYDTADAIKDVYSQQVDAIEDAVGKQIDAYNDYIDVVKEAYDAERDLYEFKKDIQKQSKSIAETERKIASLSGSTNAADIAERRKLEAQLAEQKEGINDSYYNHANDQRSNALDDEAQAYEESMNRFVEGLRKTLEEQSQELITFNETGTMVTNEFLNGVTATVMQNADVILKKYKTSGFEMSDALKQPWIDASAQLGEYGAGLSVLNDWTSDSGYFGQFKVNASGQLITPFANGAAAVSKFKNGTILAMDAIASNVRSNVSNMTSALDSVKSSYEGIKTTAERTKAAIDAANAAAAAGAQYTGSAGNVVNSQPKPTILKVDNQILSRYKLTSDQVLALGYGPLSLKAFEDLLKNYQIKYSNVFAKAQVWNTTAGERSMKYFGANYVSGPLAIRRYAKGTTGIDKNQLAIVDELGEELILHANEKTGRLEYLTKGSGVIPHDATTELMKLADIGVDGLSMPKFDSGINVMTNYITKPEFNFSVENFLKVDRVDKDTLPQLEAMMDKKIDTFAKQLNYSIKKFSR